MSFWYAPQLSGPSNICCRPTIRFRNLQEDPRHRIKDLDTCVRIAVLDDNSYIINMHTVHAYKLHYNSYEIIFLKKIFFGAVDAGVHRPLVDQLYNSSL